MTKHQNLTLQRYTKDAIRKYKAALDEHGGNVAIESALKEAVAVLDWLINAKTEG